MSRTKKGGKGPGFEYWGPRPNSWSGAIGKESKRITHKIERQRNKPKPKDFNE